MSIDRTRCRACGHCFFYHRESSEWQLMNSRRKRNLTGCTKEGCACLHADDSHVPKKARR